MVGQLRDDQRMQPKALIVITRPSRGIRQEVRQLHLKHDRFDGGEPKACDGLIQPHNRMPQAIRRGVADAQEGRGQNRFHRDDLGDTARRRADILQFAHDQQHGLRERRDFS